MLISRTRHGGGGGSGSGNGSGRWIRRGPGDQVTSSIARAFGAWGAWNCGVHRRSGPLSWESATLPWQVAHHYLAVPCPPTLLSPPPAVPGRYITSDVQHQALYQRRLCWAVHKKRRRGFRGTLHELDLSVDSASGVLGSASPPAQSWRHMVSRKPWSDVLDSCAPPPSSLICSRQPWSLRAPDWQLRLSWPPAVRTSSL
ncbi:hypothetical protein BS50DRAFT_305103 [Corynespora cassiicola Philippines]|uniref:Uncharacterized protein n=1 Tax=Corynespora cassiicola Philippines TaxID=1448308 RepID=A0A2T2NXF1_CORCC|nr:hypothetical protein BS50DRAFT_305103 [Corynespora cassiicola Philippines]